MKFKVSTKDPIEANRLAKALDMALALWDIDQLLRGKAKYEDNEYADKIREEFHDILNGYGIVLDNIIE